MPAASTKFEAGAMEKAALIHWRESLREKHGPSLVANRDPAASLASLDDAAESDLELTARFFWRRAWTSRHGGRDERSGAFFELSGLADDWQFPKIAQRAQALCDTAPAQLKNEICFWG